jgi:molybdate transport system substrate-binding protein
MKLFAVLAGLIVAHGAALADEIRTLSSTGMKSVLTSLAPEFERASGHKLAITYDTANLLMGRLRGGGEGVDLVILTDSTMDELAKLGRIAPGTRATLARSGMGLSVRAGAPKPEIKSVESLKKALLEANSIAYTTTGASGIYFAGLIDKLGIGDQVRAKAKTRSGGAVGELVARGEAEMAVQQIPELLGVGGLDFVGPLPREIQLYTAFPAAVLADAKHPAAARALIAFLSTPAAARAMQAKGMEPPEQ